MFMGLPHEFPIDLVCMCSMFKPAAFVLKQQSFDCSCLLTKEATQLLFGCICFLTKEVTQLPLDKRGNSLAS